MLLSPTILRKPAAQTKVAADIRQAEPTDTPLEQDIARVDHAMTPKELVRVGSDTESQVLARAVRRHVEHRILLNGHRTVVFR